MKKLLIGLILITFISSNFGAIGAIITEKDDNYLVKEVVSIDFTHTIFAEQCTATWCPNCPMVAGALRSIYESGDYPFYYVALVDDMNSIAKQRNRDYSFGIYAIYAFPTVYFDGGNTNIVGRMANIEATELEYRGIIESEGKRDVKQPIKLESSVSWDGDTQITVTITATNEGSIPYFGKIRSYVTEIESRWNDYEGNPYRFTLLDYAINKYVLLMPETPKTITGIFDGSANHNGNTYDDISKDNIQVITAIFNWIPNFRNGYQGEQYNQKYFSFAVDQTVASIPE